jgi:predicted Rossmann fold flavoprotein
MIIDMPANHINGKDIIVIGAGASGMMAAGQAAESGARVLLIEKMSNPGNKLTISGNSRGNFTNSGNLKDFIDMYGTNGQFLYSTFSSFFRDDILDFFKRYGIETITQNDGRIYPASNNAKDLVNALNLYITQHGVEILTGVKATRIQISNSKVTEVQTEQGVFPTTAVILATGGASYPKTGSIGDGYKIAAALGHTIIKLRPSLVPLVINEIQFAKDMQGISLYNIRLTAYQCHAQEIPLTSLPIKNYGRGIRQKHPSEPIIESRVGPIMITHFGISGPVTLQMSLAIVDALEHGPVSVAIDLQPNLDRQQLHKILQQDFDNHGKKSYRHVLSGILPKKMANYFIKITGIPADKLASNISIEERKRLVNSIKSLCFNIKRPLPISSAMVTAGGISLNEIDPRTMSSHLVKGLYFCGEIIDIDADTGGYNLTAAFSTGYTAGKQAAIFCKMNRYD